MCTSNICISPDLGEAFITLDSEIVVCGREAELITSPDRCYARAHVRREDGVAHVSDVVWTGGGPDHHGEGVDAVAEEALGVWACGELGGGFAVGAEEEGAV